MWRFWLIIAFMLLVLHTLAIKHFAALLGISIPSNRVPRYVNGTMLQTVGAKPLYFGKSES
mgnify:CR=1 FL=1